MADETGARYIPDGAGPTWTVKLCETAPPAPSSTATARWCTPAWPRSGVQVKAPVVRLIQAPAGWSPSSEKVRRLGGRSGSVALKVCARWFISLAASWDGPRMDGARFASRTVTLSRLQEAAPRSSAAVTLRWCTPGPSCSVGVQVMVPLAGSTRASPGGLSSPYVTEAAGGWSVSVAATVKDIGASSSVSWGGISPMTGGELTSRTVILKARWSVPPAPSSTVTLKAYPPGPWRSVGVQVKVPVDSSMAAPCVSSASR